MGYLNEEVNCTEPSTLVSGLCWDLCCQLVAENGSWYILILDCYEIDTCSRSRPWHQPTPSTACRLLLVVLLFKKQHIT
jgi:hypothetical protein